MNEIKHTNISCVKEEKQCEDSNSGLSHRCFLAGATDMFYEKLKQIIKSVMEQGLCGKALTAVLTADISPAEIYESDDILVTDAYFSLLHFATEEETVTDAEWKYFLECLNGDRNYSLDEKLQMSNQSGTGGSV